MEERLHPRPAPDEEGADALRPVDLVAGQGEEIHAERLRVQGELAEALHRVGVKGHAPLAADPAHGGDGKQHAGLVVPVHEADQYGVRPDRPAHVVRVQQPLRIHGEAGHLEALAAEVGGGVQDGVVLHGGEDHMTTALLLGRGDAHEGQVVGLGPPRGEDDGVLVGRSQGPRDGRPSPLQGLSRLTPPDVERAGIAEPLRQEGRHRRQDLGVERRGGVVIEIHSHRVDANPTDPAIAGMCRRTRDLRPGRTRRRAKRTRGIRTQRR